VPIPRVATIDVNLEKITDEIHITPFSDLHIDSRDFNEEGFDEFCKERAKLRNHRGILLGDVMDLVVPPDLRRWSASTQDASIIGMDDWLNAAVDLATKRLIDTGIKWDFISPGNHEIEFRKRHGVDTTQMLARDLRCPRGGYSGYIRYRLMVPFKGKKKLAGVFVICYHHGAWGGRVVKGFGGARDWFRGFDGWHVALYAHNHQATVHREQRQRVAKNNTVVEYPVYFVDCGSWVRSLTRDAKRVHYAERHGHMPTTQVSPLLKIKTRNLGSKKDRSSGQKPGLYFEYTVEM
jgi:hypothetical protein